MARLSEQDRKAILGDDFFPDVPSGNLADKRNLWQRIMRFFRTLIPGS